MTDSTIALIEPVAWRRATKYGWDVRYFKPTASTPGGSWVPLYDGSALTKADERAEKLLSEALEWKSMYLEACKRYEKAEHALSVIFPAPAHTEGSKP